MALREITVRGSSDRPIVFQRVTVDGVTLSLRFAWNGREGRWFLSIFATDGTAIALGRKLVSGWEPTRRVRSERMPGGKFLCLDRTSGGVDPDLDGFAERCLFAYAEASEFLEVDAPAYIGPSGE